MKTLISFTELVTWYKLKKKANPMKKGKEKLMKLEIDCDTCLWDSFFVNDIGIVILHCTKKVGQKIYFLKL